MYRWRKEVPVDLAERLRRIAFGSSLPGETLPTFVLALEVRNAERFMEKLRHGQPPVIARTEGGRILLDPRTVLPEQEGALLVNLMNALPKPSTRKRG